MNDSRTLVIGSRGSQLALWQSKHIASILTARFPDRSIEIKTIKTTGDRILDAPLAKIGDKGLFTKQIEVALLNGEIDLAVHSLKDLPTALEPGLALGAITVREDARDAFVSKNGLRLEDLPIGASVATSSLRRRAQLLFLRPDLHIEDIRGNLDTRLRKLDDNPALSAIILAKAGLCRLGLDHRITHVIDTDRMLPAVGQGALAVEIRQDDPAVEQIVSVLDDPDTRAATIAERALLAALEGGCQIPIGAHGQVQDGRLTLAAMVASLDGKILYRESQTGDPKNPQQVGRKLADRLLEMGAKAVLDEIVLQTRSDR